MTSTLQFLGAARTVTGSRFLLRAAGSEILVDCGLFQGLRDLRERNWDRMPIDPRKVDAVVLTHGHIDHVGALPRLVRQGFRGPVYCTPATLGLLEILLPDSARLQEEEAEYANRKGYTRHRPALPLYTPRDAEETLRQVRTVDYRVPAALAPGIEGVFHPNGHILGSAFVEVRAEGVTTVFSGDVGGYDSEVMRPPASLPEHFDFLVVEATYGGREPEGEPVDDRLTALIGPVLERGGVVVIPAFAVGRTTLVLFHLRKLMQAGRIPDVPVVVDSPMATDAVELYCRHADELNLREDQLKDAALCPLRPAKVALIRTRDASILLNRQRGPAIIVSANGMATAGRVLHHLKHRLPDPDNLVLLVGYQAEGTRGRKLLQGAREVKMLGQWIPVRAQVAAVRGLSAHGASCEILRWMKTASRPPRRTFLVHGEVESLARMGERVDAELGWAHSAPDYLEEVALEK